MLEIKEAREFHDGIRKSSNLEIYTKHRKMSSLKNVLIYSLSLCLYFNHSKLFCIFSPLFKIDLK